MSASEILTVSALVVFAALLLAVWFADRRRARPAGGRTPVSGVVGTFDEVFYPSAAKAIEIREIQRELPVEVSHAGDGLKPGDKIVIELGAAGGGATILR